MSNPSKNIPTPMRLNTFRCNRVTGRRSRRASTLIADTLCFLPLRRLASADDRDALDFDQHARIRESGDRDRGTRREIFAEDFSSDLSHSRCVTGVGEEDGHRHDVLQRRPGLVQRRLDVLERLTHLLLEVTGERIAGRVLLTRVASDPDDLASFGDYCWGERSRLLPCPAHERLLHEPLLRFATANHLQSIAELLKRVKCPSATESAEYNIRGGRIWCSMSRPGQRHCGPYQARQTS